MIPSPDPRSNRRWLSTDELIAVFIALTSIGAIFFWSISQKDRGLDLPFLQVPVASNSPTTAPTLPPSPSTQASTPPPPSQATVEKPEAAVSSPVVTPESPSPLSPALQAAPFVAAAPKVVASSPQASSAPAAPASVAPKKFTDVPADYWASAPIAALSAQGILNGFPDGSFRPNKPISRVEFAEIIRKAFNQPTSRGVLKFSDVKADSPALPAINEATQTRFMSGFPDGSFQPNRPIPRLQVWLALATGLNLQLKQPPDQVLSRYQDADQTPKYAVNKVAAAIESGLVLNDANPNVLALNQVTTRAEVAALIYEALKK